MEKDFGKITKVDLREFFKNEATEFTPWLAQHLQDISELLGIEITDAQTLLSKINGIMAFGRVFRV